MAFSLVAFAVAALVMVAENDVAEVKIGCRGCLMVILFFFVLWGLIFGVTWNGQHHGISCTTDRGVVIE